MEKSSENMDYEKAAVLRDRIKALTQIQSSQKIKGRDENITLPVQTADPDNYGGDKVNILFGLNWIPTPSYKGLRLSLEGGIPIHQRLNGPQMEEDFVISTGIQYAF